MYNQFTVTPLEQRGSSSLEGTAYLCKQIEPLFSKYNIKSMFDAGANDVAWQAQRLATMVEYHAGEKNMAIVQIGKNNFPHIDIVCHDMTVDPFPKVDVLFIRDVTIHMNNFYKKNMLKNWLLSSIPWILMTQDSSCNLNKDSMQTVGEIYHADVNWYLSPWSFPQPHDKIYEFDNERCQRYMALWHRDQLKDLI